MSGIHARLSPSGAHRWMTCAGSVVLEAQYPDVSSGYAKEGTLAHDLASGHLALHWRLEEYVGEEWSFDDGSTMTITQEMVEHVLGYAERVRAFAEGGSLRVEQRVPVGHITGEDGAGGTSDVVVIGDDWIKIADLKYGQGVPVYAEDNEQMQLYALGAIERYSSFADFKTITMAIDQPRIGHTIADSQWTIPVEQLLEFGEKARKHAEVTRQAMLHGPEDDALRAFLQPGEKQCKFCLAKATCPALREEMMLVAAGSVESPATLAEFAEFVPLDVDETIGENYLSVAMGKVELVEQWCKAVRAEVYNLLAAGRKVDGFKLVEGKRGNRAWTDEAAVEALMKQLRIKADVIYSRSLVSPTQAEKALKKTDPKRWEKLNAFITRADGKPSVAPASDPRPELALTNLEDLRAVAAQETEE